MDKPVVLDEQWNHEHCWHLFRGPIHMVIPDGHVIEKCCKCPATRTIHADHSAARESLRKAWKQAQEGKTKPLSTLWRGL